MRTRNVLWCTGSCTQVTQTEDSVDLGTRLQAKCKTNKMADFTHVCGVNSKPAKFLFALLSEKKVTEASTVTVRSATARWVDMSFFFTSFLRYFKFQYSVKVCQRCWELLLSLRLEIRFSQNLAKLGGGCTPVETLVASRFAYEAIHRSTLFSLEPKTLIEGPFEGSRTVYRPPSLFSMFL